MKIVEKKINKYYETHTRTRDSMCIRRVWCVRVKNTDDKKKVDARARTDVRHTTTPGGATWRRKAVVVIVIAAAADTASERRKRVNVVLFVYLLLLTPLIRYRTLYRILKCKSYIQGRLEGGASCAVVQSPAD